MMKVAVSVGAAGGIVATLACLYATAIIMNDINDMYNDIMDGMGQFKVSTVSSLLIYPWSIHYTSFLDPSDPQSKRVRALGALF